MFEETPPTYLQQERFNQLYGMLDTNGVPKPFIMWIQGAALIAWLASVGRSTHPKDGVVLHNELYRYNISTGRVRKAEPFDPAKHKPRARQ